MGEEFLTQILLSVYLISWAILQNPLPLAALVCFFPFSFPWERRKGPQTSLFHPAHIVLCLSALFLPCNATALTSHNLLKWDSCNWFGLKTRFLPYSQTRHITLSTVCCSLRGNCLPFPPPFQVENKLQVIAWSWSCLALDSGCTLGQTGWEGKGSNSRVQNSACKRKVKFRQWGKCAQAKKSHAAVSNFLRLRSQARLEGLCLGPVQLQVDGKLGIRESALWLLSLVLLLGAAAGSVTAYIFHLNSDDWVLLDFMLFSQLLTWAAHPLLGKLHPPCSVSCSESPHGWKRSLPSQSIQLHVTASHQWFLAATYTHLKPKPFFMTLPTSWLYVKALQPVYFLPPILIPQPEGDDYCLTI